MTGTVSAYNSAQKIQEKAATATAIDATPIYTCPAGKKAQVQLVYQYITAGANANTGLLVNSVAIRTLLAGDLGKTNTDTFQLNAGEEFHFHGNVADNSTVNYSYKILELPA